MSFSLRREPAIWLTLFATIVRFAGAFLVDLTDEQQAILNAAATAIAGAIVAIWVRRDGQIAALLGAAQALLSLAVGFGLDVTAENQAVIMSVIGAAAAAFIRTQVVAAKPAPEVSPAP